MVKKIKSNNRNQSLNISDALRSALMYQQKGELQQAAALYNEILCADKNNADALHLLGVIARESGKNEEAIELIEKGIASYRRALSLKPDYPEALNNLGAALKEQGKLDEAVVCYHRALSLKADYPEALNNLGVALKEQGKFEKAIMSFICALSLKPDFYQAHNNLGAALKEQGKLDEAVVCFHRALSLKPDYPEALNNLGIALKEQGKLEEAITSYVRALSLNPDFYQAHNNLGIALQKKGRIEEAVTSFHRALSLKPDWPDGHFNLSVAYLLKGNFKEGWEESQYRLRKQDVSKSFYPYHLDFTQPYWDGSDIKGKTILLWAEQGLGDVVQFIRYVPMVFEKTDKIIVECQKELITLMQRINSIHQVVAQGQQLPDFDVHCPLLTLPLVFNTTLQTIPAAIPYIMSDRQKVLMWLQRLQSDSARLKVGLCWAGNPAHKNDRIRSISLDLFSQLGEMEDVTFYSLQKGEAAGQTGNPPNGMHLVDYTNDLNDFSDTAALIENLDLVISVDTVIVHLAGALGKPVWTLLPFMPDWRWMLDRGDSPWYPTMRLYRQPAYGDWNSVLRMIKHELHAVTI